MRGTDRQGPRSRSQSNRVPSSNSQGMWGVGVYGFMVCRNRMCGYQVSTFISNRQVVRGIIETSSSWELGNTSPTMYASTEYI